MFALKMKKWGAIIILIVANTFNGFSQFESPTSPDTPAAQTDLADDEPTKSELREKIIVGGGLDLQFGQYTSIGITPLVGYAITDNLLAGGIFTYRYFKYDAFNGTNPEANTFGFSPFVRFFVYKGLFAHMEYEMLYGQFEYTRSYYWLDSFLIGPGYGSRIGNHGFVGLYLLWNLTPDPTYMVYSNPLIRVSFAIDL